jgi:hypothetical protein
MYLRTLTLAALLCLPLLANDTLATLGAGGLVPMQSAQISMEREEEASDRQVRCACPTNHSLGRGSEQSVSGSDRRC